MYNPYHCLDVLEVQILSLKARKEKAQDFELNINMKVEVELLDAQIDALEKEYYRIQEEL